MGRIVITLGVLLACCRVSSGGEIEALHRQQAKDSQPDPNPFLKPERNRSGVTEIGLERTECFGPCPAYTVVIKRDGTVRYRGEQHAKLAGEHTGKVSQAAFRRLAAFVLEAGFADFETTYSAPVTDMPSTYTMILKDGRPKVVKDYGDAGPTKLWAIEQLIDKLLLETTWDDKTKLRGE
jgi:hypothetical protein